MELATTVAECKEIFRKEIAEWQKKFGDDKSLMRNLALLNLQIGNRKKGWEYYCTIKHDDRVSLDRNPHTDEIKELKLKDIKHDNLTLIKNTYYWD